MAAATLEGKEDEMASALASASNLNCSCIAKAKSAGRTGRVNTTPPPPADDDAASDNADDNEDADEVMRSMASRMSSATRSKVSSASSRSLKFNSPPNVAPKMPVQALELVMLLSMMTGMKWVLGNFVMLWENSLQQLSREFPLFTFE